MWLAIVLSTCSHWVIKSAVKNNELANCRRRLSHTCVVWGGSQEKMQWFFVHACFKSNGRGLIIVSACARVCGYN